MVKIDLEKAYDHINWTFLEKVLEAVGFEDQLIKLIMFCICSSSLAIIWNGEILEEFKPQRGLRQGDLLSPYLFVLCTETLGNQIQLAIDEAKWKGIKPRRWSERVSHLFFGKDLILFAKATLKQAQVMEQILQEFFSLSGQKVNTSKSKLFVSKKVKPCIARILG